MIDNEVIDNEQKLKALYIMAGVLGGLHDQLDLVREGNDNRNPIDHNVEQAQINIENAMMRVEQVVRRLTPDDAPERKPEPDGDPLDYWTVREIAEKLNVSRMTIYRMTEDKTLPSFKIGRHIRITKAAFANYLEGLL